MLSFAALNFALNTSKTAARVVKSARQSKTYRDLRAKVKQGQLDRRMTKEGERLAAYLDGRSHHGLELEGKKSPLDKQNDAMAAALKGDLKAQHLRKNPAKATTLAPVPAPQRPKSAARTPAAPPKTAPPSPAPQKPAPTNQKPAAPTPSRPPPRRR